MKAKGVCRMTFFGGGNKKTLSLPVDNKGSKSYSMIKRQYKPVNTLSKVTRRNWRHNKHTYVI